jgi:predicted ribosome-associated RNA-binding protein Tma20
VLSSSEIKTENLAEIITSSRADYLIVIGDKNMKNRSCQAKKRGKLVEMNVRIF